MLQSDTFVMNGLERLCKQGLKLSKNIDPRIAPHGGRMIKFSTGRAMAGGSGL